MLGYWTCQSKHYTFIFTSNSEAGASVLSVNREEMFLAIYYNILVWESQMTTWTFYKNARLAKGLTIVVWLSVDVTYCTFL